MPFPLDPHGRVHLSSGALFVSLCCSLRLCCSPMIHTVAFIFQVARCACHCAVPTWSCSSFKWRVVRVTALVLFHMIHMVAFIFQGARCACHCAVPTWSCSSFKWRVVRITVLFPHGSVHLSRGVLCVSLRLCCSHMIHMVALIFQGERVTVLFPHGRVHLLSGVLCVSLRFCCST